MSNVERAQRGSPLATMKAAKIEEHRRRVEAEQAALKQAQSAAAKGSQEFQRFWGGVPVKDAKDNLPAIILPEDLACADPKEFGFCVFAQAFRRQYGAKRVFICRTVAYVELPTKDGSLVVNRYTLPEPTRRLIMDFDRRKPIPPKAGFLLTAPSPSDQLATRKTQAYRNREKQLRRERIAGTRERIGDRGLGKFEENKFADLSVRNATGKVCFIGNNKKIPPVDATRPTAVKKNGAPT